jgi:hypothetical protein
MAPTDGIFFLMPVGMGLLWVLYHLFRALGLNEHWAAFIIYFLVWPFGLIISRCLCKLFWPRKVRQAEENAGERRGERPVWW